MKKIRVGVLRGGIALEHNVSLKSGETVLRNLDKNKFDVFDIIISKERNWFFEGVEIQPESLKAKVDIVFSVLHGKFGEDGQVQKILSDNKILFVGSGIQASIDSFSKIITKEKILKEGVDTPKWMKIKKKPLNFKDETKMIVENFGTECVVKAVNEGSSFGVYVCHNEDEIKDALKKVFEISDNVFVEEYIKGREFTCGVFDGPKGLEALPIVEIIPESSQEFFDFDAKYNGKVKEICPAVIEDEFVKNEIWEISKKVHKILNLKDYSRTDFIFNEKTGRIVVLEVNTLPGMTETSLLPKELREAGYSLKEFLSFVILKRFK